MKLRSYILAALCMVSTVLQAQSIWTSAEAKFKVLPKITIGAEAEYRSRDWFSDTDRWAIGAGVDYKAFSFLKFSAGYTFINRHTATETTNKGNIIPAYWQPRHRGYFAATGSISFARFTLSLRERYQYTYRPEQTVGKFAPDGVTPKPDEVVASKGKHILRSRLELEYNIRKSAFSPFASCDLYSDLSGAFATEKTRWTIGSSYKINRNNALTLFYRYIDRTDSDDTGGNVIGVGYRFKL